MNRVLAPAAVALATGIGLALLAWDFWRLRRGQAEDQVERWRRG